MHRLFRGLSVVVIVLGLICCSKNDQTGSATKRGFYYWQTSSFGFDWRDTVYRAMNVDVLYVRLFDVDWNDELQQPVPVSPFYGSYYFKSDFSNEFVPVVFITNETFKNLDLEQTVVLARNVHKKVMAAISLMFVEDNSGSDDWWRQDPYRVGPGMNRLQQHDSAYAAGISRLREVQFDCDWTKTTRYKYFAFLKESRKLFAGQQISSTIRLYQYKYPREAGVPPVNRGMLMCYNAGDVKDRRSVNSIFDKKEVMSYLKSGDYSLPLDYALPIFNWALLYRGNSLEAILSPELLQQEYGGSLTAVDDAHIRVDQDFVYGHDAGSLFVRKGDEIRVEEPDMEDVADVARWLSVHKNNPGAVLTFYHLNNYDLQKHSKAIEGIFNSF